MPTPTNPEQMQPVCDVTPSDVEEACRQIPRYDDETIRRLREMFNGLKSNKESEIVAHMCSGMLEEILRLRRDLRDARCPVAARETQGNFQCTREFGHEGPCAAVEVNNVVR